MTHDASKVTSSKPSIGGAVWVAPIGTAIPQDAKTALNAEYKSLGYCSDDGLTNSNSPETDNQKAWGGDIVLVLQTGKEDTFQFKLIESLNIDVLKTVYGQDNVTGDLETGLKIASRNDEPEQFIWVFEMILKGNVLKRIVVPCAAITEIGDIVYKDDESIGYECTISAVADETGATHYEHLIKSSSKQLEEK